MWKLVAQLIDAFTVIYPDAEWGYAHVVISDLNLEDEYIETCLAKFEAVENKVPEEIATVALLQILLTIPEDDRCVPDRD